MYVVQTQDESLLQDEHGHSQRRAAVENSGRLVATIGVHVPAACDLLMPYWSQFFGGRLIQTLQDRRQSESGQ